MERKGVGGGVGDLHKGGSASCIARRLATMMAVEVCIAWVRCIMSNIQGELDTRFDETYFTKASQGFKRE